MISIEQRQSRETGSSWVDTEDGTKKPGRRPYLAPTVVRWGKLVEITQGPFGALVDNPFAGSRNAE